MQKGILFIACLFCATGLSAQSYIHSVYFGGGSYYIDGQQVEDIGAFIRSIPNIQHCQITVSSHTDNIGGAEYNNWLSQMRGQAVIGQLTQLEISPDRINVANNGQYNPTFDNRTHDGRLANRRVDIIIEPVIL